MKKALIFWQSQSGNTYACVLSAKEGLENAGYEVVLHHILSKVPAVFDADLYLFAFPTYNFKPATAMKEFIGNMPVLKDKKPALAVVTCTGLIANIPYVLRRRLAKKNIKLASVYKARSSETYILLRKYTKGTMKLDGKPDEAMLSDVKKFITGKVAGNFKRDIFIFNPFSIFHWLGVITPEAAPGKPYTKRTWMKETCTLCGYCYALCPSGSIKREGTELTVNTGTCVGCCGCFNICPTGSWKLENYGDEFLLKNKHTPELLKTVKK